MNFVLVANRLNVNKRYVKRIDVRRRDVWEK